MSVITDGSNWRNVAIGAESLYSVTSGVDNVVLGHGAGYSLTTGSDNIFIGYQAGYNETGSNKLYIANSNTATPLIYGDFSTKAIVINQADGATAFFKLAGATGKLRMYGYYDATYGACIESLITGEGSYVPMTLSASNLYLWVNSSVGIATITPDSSTRLSLKESASISAAWTAFDTDNAVLGKFGIARTTNELVTGSAQNDAVFSSIYGKLNLATNNAIQLAIDTSGNVTINNGGLKVDGALKAAGFLYDGTSTPTNTTRLNYDGYFYATRVYNAIWSDVADFQELDDLLVYGKCYYDSKSGAKICTERCQKGVIGIASDTYGFGVGSGGDSNKAPFAVAGWVLAFVDKEYEIGTPLTNDASGGLTEMKRFEVVMYSERLVAIYKRKEFSEYIGTEDQKVLVNGRHWVKIK
jgi:hypothetical protein